MSSTYWKWEIYRFAVWVVNSIDGTDALITFDESVDEMERAIKKYRESKKKVK